jgi:NADPH:quinone reductase-like Zn-dependent oxidoreductase
MTRPAALLRSAQPTTPRSRKGNILMNAMKVMRFNDLPDAPALIADTISIPQPGDGELLIRVRAAGVTPTELRWYPTTHRPDGGRRIGAIPGHEFSGTVEAVGSLVDSDYLGRSVFGMNDWFADGATAEYCLAKPAAVAFKPDALSHHQAASVPIGTLTAWQGLYERARLRSGESILIHGGAGGVGVYAIQLARRTGARIATTASARNCEFLRRLGAERVIDYRTERFEDDMRDVDVVFDCVGGETLKRSWGVLKPEGGMVTIATDSEGTQDNRRKAAFFIVEPKQAQLVEIAQLIDRGELEPFVDGLIPLSAASAAYLGAALRLHGYGKLVIDVAEERHTASLPQPGVAAQ